MNQFPILQKLKIKIQLFLYVIAATLKLIIKKWIKYFKKILLSTSIKLEKILKNETAKTTINNFRILL